MNEKQFIKLMRDMYKSDIEIASDLSEIFEKYLNTLNTTETNYTEINYKDIFTFLESPYEEDKEDDQFSKAWKANNDACKAILYETSKKLREILYTHYPIGGKLCIK